MPAGCLQRRRQTALKLSLRGENRAKRGDRRASKQASDKRIEASFESRARDCYGLDGAVIE